MPVTFKKRRKARIEETGLRNAGEGGAQTDRLFYLPPLQIQRLNPGALAGRIFLCEFVVRPENRFLPEKKRGRENYSGAVFQRRAQIQGKQPFKAQFDNTEPA